MRTSRPAFVLIAVLWATIGVSALAVGVALIARRTTGEARNRIAARTAAWKAEDCLARARAAIAAVLEDDSAMAPDSSSWAILDRRVPSSAFRSAMCSTDLRAAGQALDVNTIDTATLLRLLFALGVAPATSDSVRDAIFDWRDADDQPRPRGAERSWYKLRRRAMPRNGPFANARELDLVRGVASVPGLDTLLGTERGRVALNQAPLSVVAALPGFTREATALVAEHRLRGAPITDLLTFAGELSPAARDTLQAHYNELLQTSTTMPDAWILTSRGTAGAPPIHSVIELRLVRAGARAAIVRRRTWVE